MTRLKFFATLCLLLLFTVPAFGQAPLIAPTQTVTLSLIGTESLSAVCTPAQVNFASTPGALVPGDAPISCVATWNVSPLRVSITSALGFANSATAMTGAMTLPSSAVQVSANGGAAVPCGSTLVTPTVIGAAASCGTGNVTNLTNNFASTKTDSFAVSIQLPNPVPAGTTTGSLLIVYFAL